MNSSIFTITAHSNLHVGNGQASTGVVDNVVQRDLTSSLPCINSTSLKGALREYFEQSDDLKKMVEDIFGSYPNENDKNNLKQGNFNFYQANLLSIPMRSDKKQFFRVTSPQILQNLLEQLKIFNFNKNFDTLIEVIKNFLEKEEVKKISPNSPICEDIEGAIVELHQIKTKEVENFFPIEIKKICGENLLLMENQQFNQLVKKLPIIARNQLENGESKNLFYEEVVPRESIFTFFISSKNEIKDNFEISLIQIGANATVGYGFCSIKKIL